MVFIIKQYTMVGGVYGVGKSSLTGALKYKRNDLGPVIDFDKIANNLDSRNISAGKNEIQQIREYGENGISFTLETTLAGSRPVAIVKIMQALGYYIRLCYVGLNSAEESIERVHKRVAKGGHVISDKDIVRSFNNRFEDLFMIIPFCDEVSFFDNSNGFVEVAQYKNGETNAMADYMPKWIIDMQTAYLKSSFHETDHVQKPTGT